MAKGIEILDVSIGTGEEVLAGTTVVLNLRMFLRQGEEVFVYPEPRVRIDLKGRHCIAGVRKGIIGMRVGGVRNITISPHLAFGADGVPGKVPPNALLRCEVELLEVRAAGVRKPEDFPPGKHLHVFRPGEAVRNQPRWQFGMDEDGRCGVYISIPIPGVSWRHTRNRTLAWQLDRNAASALFYEAMTLPERFPNECLHGDALWSDQTEPANGITRDRETDTPCVTISVSERGQRLSDYSLKETSHALKSFELYRVIRSQIESALGPGKEDEGVKSPGE
jgi:FKBP-type peptidyl-prolyl cis-trans isomerase